MAVLYMKRRNGNLEEIDRTEVLLNSLNPQWITKLSVTYQFEVVQPLVYASLILTTEAFYTILVFILFYLFYLGFESMISTVNFIKYQ